MPGERIFRQGRVLSPFPEDQDPLRIPSPGPQTYPTTQITHPSNSRAPEALLFDLSTTFLPLNYSCLGAH